MSFQLGSLKYKVELDDKEAKNSLTAFDKNLIKIGDAFAKAGKELTTKLTLPLVAIGGASLKAASDFEVASRKFAGAFKGAEVEANTAIKNLNENFGISVSEGTKLLGFTGDLLKGFGATSTEALNLAENTNELAAALAAYNGVPVAQASEAITKALVGERESLKLLGVVIREEDVNQRLLLKGQQDLTGQALLLAKAEATLELSAEQSTDAINNFSSNTDTAAFQVVSLLADTKDLAVKLGTGLLPILKEAIGTIKGWVDKLQDLDESQVKTILGIGALAAATGPLLSAFGLITKAVGALKVALAFLAANPIVAVITAIGAAAVGFAAFVSSQRQKQLEELTEKFGGLAKQTGVAEENINSFLTTAQRIETALENGDYARSFMTADDAAKDLDYQIRAIADSTGLTIEQIARIAEISDRVSIETKQALEVLRQESDELMKQEEINLGIASGFTVRNKLAEESAKLAALTGDKEKAITAELEKQKTAREAAIKAQIDARLTAAKNYSDTLKEIQAQYDYGLITKGELLEGQLEAAKKQVEELIAAGYTDPKALGSNFGYATLQEMLKIIPELEDKIKKFKETQEDNSQAVVDIGEKYVRLYEGITLDKIELLKKEKEAAIKEAEKIGADTLIIKKYYDKLIEDVNKERLAAQEADEKAYYDNIITLARGYISVFTNLGNQITGIYDQQLTNASSVYDNFMTINKAEIETLEEKAKTEEGLTEDEKIRLDELNEEKKQLLKDQYKAQLAAFKAQQAMSIVQATIAGAEAAIQAYKSLAGIPIVGPTLGVAAAAAVAALTTKQIELIAKQEPPVEPKLAEGGIVNNPGEGIKAILGEAGPEAILPLTDKTLSVLGEAIVETQQATTKQESSGDIVINFEGNRLAIIKNGVQELFRNRAITIPSAVVI